MRIMLKFQALIREHSPRIARTLTAEQGKTLPDAEGDIFRGLEVVEHACSVGSLQQGEFLENVAGAVDTCTLRCAAPGLKTMIAASPCGPSASCLRYTSAPPARLGGGPGPPFLTYTVYGLDAASRSNCAGSHMARFQQSFSSARYVEQSHLASAVHLAWHCAAERSATAPWLSGP